MVREPTTPLVSNQSICQIPNIQEQLLAKIEKNTINDPIYIEFVKKFFLYIPSDYLSPEKLDLFYEFSNEAYLFFKQKDKNKRKLLIKNSETISQLVEVDSRGEATGGIKNTKKVRKKEFQEVESFDYASEPTLTILLLSDNKSFIVGSLNCLLVQLNLHPKFILHPTLLTIRDEKGLLQQIRDKCVNTNESLVFIKILGNFDQYYIKELEEKINNLMDLVDQTNNVWDKILKEIDDSAKNISHNNKLGSEFDNVSKESLDFLNWLVKDNFTFLGRIKFDLNNSELDQEGAIKIWENNIEEITNIINFSTNEDNKNKLIVLGRINSVSPIHHNALVDYVLVKGLNSNGEYISGIILFGLYSSNLAYQSFDNIPLLKDKMNFSLEKSGFSPKEYNYKKLKIIIESLPRESIIQINENDLYCMGLNMLSSMMSHKLKLFIYAESSGSLVNILIFLSKEKLTLSSQNTIIKYLLQEFPGEVVANFVTDITQNFAHLFVTIAVINKNIDGFSAQKIEDYINNISTLWNESLYKKLSEQKGEFQAGIDIKQLDPIFPDDYKNRYDADEAVKDIQYLREASNKNEPNFNLKILDAIDCRLKIYTPQQIPLYNIIPCIENLGFKAIDERSFHINPTQNIKESWLYEFILHSSIPIEKEPHVFKQNVEEALDKMMHGTLAIDSLSKLIGLVGLNWKEVKLIKALTRYLHQTGFAYGKGYVQLTLNKHYKYTESLVKFFDAKFNPDNQSKETIKIISNQINNYLTTVTASAEDKVLRHMFNLIDSIIRTNYYQQADGNLKNYISFKFNSTKVLDLVRPVPYREIFVYSNDFEGLHLRGGPVARGGIRLSDRGEDYRTEVLGLMKAQMTKNTIIVPVGSKGGLFVTLSPENYSPAEYKEKIVECYKNFLRGLLDITDNVINGKVVFPMRTILYDSADPYLVVAADKGTATFSDYANNVSAEYNYWLADAFATGGSEGYDHKKIGITSKGAWISVKRHFETIGIDPEKDPITVVGIGDMAGDVFGNGLLRSKTMKLVAAFNHIHIFIDPTPDPEISYKERERLFIKPNSKWSDYDSKLISPGGGIFERTSKSITLTPQAKKLLDLNIDEISPEELIKTILKANVDLIWNGGIGTYIKATSESHLEIGDKANDNLRCNGNEIRAKVIAEGGNLGCSQLGRIEYSKKGGLINTDFIDNSGGVDCSDHEVNIKIALNNALSKGKITLEERNTLLRTMTDQVEQLVLLDNYKQTQAITISTDSPTFTVEMFSELIDSLEEVKLLDRAVEFLPSREELSKRSINKEKLTRPELAVLLSYSKIACFNELADAEILKDKYFEQYLVNYFPSKMTEKFRDEILNHQLGNDIIRTVVTNNIVNQLGGALINTLKKDTGATTPDIVKAYLIVCEIFDLNNLWYKVEALGPEIDHAIKIDMFTELTKIMRRGSAWFIKTLDSSDKIMEVVYEYKDPSKDLSKTINKLLTGEAKTKFEERVEKYILAGIDRNLAVEIAVLDSLISALDIISIAKNSGANYNHVASIYFLFGSEFHIDWLRKECDHLIDDSYWNRLSIQSLKDDFYDKQKRLLIKITSHFKDKKVDLNTWIEDNKSISKDFTDFVTNIKLHEDININMIILANKKFETFLRKLG